MTENIGTELATEPESTTEENSEDGQHDTESREEYEGDGEKEEAENSIVSYAQWALFSILLVVVFIATLRFYMAASTAIDEFVTAQFRPLFQAAFNLAILLVSGLGLSVLVRNMR